jgi:DNA invertase Pin-like site-specific DNA recombinase
LGAEFPLPGDLFCSERAAGVLAARGAKRDASIADQLRVCREFAARQGWTIVQEFTDHAISGATLLRSGFQALMRDALNQRFDVVLAEALDGFSRDQEDTAGRKGDPQARSSY